MSAISLFPFALLLCTCSVAGLEEQTCDASKRGHVIEPDAQAYIGVVLAMHESANSMYGCGAALDTTKEYEVMRFALSRINQDHGDLDGDAITQSYIPGVKIGLQVHDSCSRPEVSTAALLDIVPNIAAQEGWCRANRSKLFLGVIGDVTSDSTAAMARLLGKHKVAQISFSASAPSLRNKEKYPFLLRTVRPAIDEARAMARVAVALNWTYVAVVYTDSLAGTEGMAEFLRAAKGAGVCVALVRQINETFTTRFTIQETLTAILSTGATGVVYFGELQGVSRLFAAAEHVSGAGKLQWLLPSTVGNRDNLGLRNAYARGVITLTPTLTRVPEFEDGWVLIPPDKPPFDTPWFSEWYMTMHQCRLNGVNYSPFKSYPYCRHQSASERKRMYKQFYQVESAILAVFSYAKALKNAHVALCGEHHSGMCDALTRYSPEDFYRNYLKVLDFTFTTGDRVPAFVGKRVAFTHQGELETSASYDVWSFSNAHGDYSFTKVGTSRPARTTLDLVSILLYNPTRTTILQRRPSSTCPNGTCSQCVAPPGGNMASDFVYVPGDVLITGLFPVRTSAGVGGCWAASPAGVQYAAAFMFALEQVSNRGGLSTQATLGGVAFNDCGNDAFATNLISELANGSLMLTDQSGHAIDHTDIHAMVTLSGQTGDASSVSAISGMGIPVLGTWSKPSNITTPLVASVVPSDEKRLRAVILTLKRLRWKSVQLVHEGHTSGTHLATQFKELAAKEGICVAEVHTLVFGTKYDDIVENMKRHRQLTGVVFLADMIVYRTLMLAINSLSYSPEQMFVVSLERHMSNEEIIDGLNPAVIDRTIVIRLGDDPIVDRFKEFLRTRPASFYMANAWFQEWYESTMHCYLDNASQKSYMKKCKEEAITAVVDPNVAQVIHAVEAIASGLNATLSHYCGTVGGATGVCTRYINAPDRSRQMFDDIMKTRSLEAPYFHFVDRQGDLPFKIFSIQTKKFIEVGTYSPGNDTIRMQVDQTLYRVGINHTSSCPGTCAECDYVYNINRGDAPSNADLLIGGVFDIHSAASSPLSCGDVTPDGYPYLEGLLFALDRVNSGRAPVRRLPGVTIGSVTFDGCSSDLKAADLVAEYHADTNIDEQLPKKVKDIKRLVAWVTQGSTSATLEVGDVTRELGRPHLGITSNSAKVTDRSRMATYFNLQGTDDKVAEAIVRLVAHMGWKYIQVVHENSAWGREGLGVLRAAGSSHSVCVVTSYELHTDGTHVSIVNKLKTSPAEVVILFLDIPDVTRMLQAKQSISGDADNLIFVVYDRYGELVSLKNDTKSAGMNMLVYRPDIALVPEFEAVLANKNPSGDNSSVWFKEYYERMYRCNLKNSFHYNEECHLPRKVTEAPDYHQNVLVRNVMNAVYAVTAALDSLLRDRCGWSYSGVCNAFWEGDDVYSQLIKKLERANFTENGVKFAFTNRQYLEGYSIYQYKDRSQPRKVASFKGSVLTMAVAGLGDDYKVTTTSCGSSCGQCQSAGGKAEQFDYVSGDIIIGGVFDLHLAGSNAFTCGDLNPHQGVPLMEAFKYALSVVNDHDKDSIFKDKLKGVKLGGLSLDACESATRAGNLLANLHSGYQSLVTSSGVINSTNIAVYIGAMDSDTSKQMARVLNVVRIPQISYGATSVELSDEATYPYFLRTVPADDKQARAMIALLVRFQVKYVQVVHSPSSYGAQGAAEFTRQAKHRSICIAQNTTFDPSVATANDVVTHMLKKRDANVVVVFLDPHHIKPFLEGIRNNPSAYGHFHFIGSEVWANSRDFLEGNLAAEAAAGAVILGVETADLKEFDQFLSNEHFSTSGNNNAWFDEYFQWLYQCHLPAGSMQEKFPKPCSEIKKGAARAAAYQQDPYVLYTVNAVYAAALGVDAALRKLCGDDYNGVCQAYLTSSTRSEPTLAGIKAARFTDATKQVFEYDNGESIRGYHIYSITKSHGGDFNNVGSYDDTHLLKIDANFKVNWVSNCEAKGACSECPLIGQHHSQYMQRHAPEDINIVGLFDVHGASVDTLQCGPLNTHTGFYNLLAFFYALDQVNDDPTKFKLASNVKLGATAIDTCGSPVRVTADVFAILSGRGLDWRDSERVAPDSVVAYVVGGGSGNSVAATRLLSPRQITTISPTATADALSGDPYFLRTVPPNNVQAAAMADITAALDWVYFSSVRSDDDYARAATEAFLRAVQARNNGNTELSLCLAKSFVLAANATEDDAKKIIKALSEVTGSRAVVLFTSPADTRKLLDAAKSLKLRGRFVFLGSEQWGNNSKVVADVEEMALGAVTLQVVSGVPKGFLRYVSSVTVTQHKDIPDDWFEEFWQRIHKCRLENATVVLTQFKRICSLNLRISEDMIDVPASVLQTIIATQQVALGLADIEECPSGSKPILAECLATLPKRNTLIYDSIRKSTWVAPSGELASGNQMTFTFTKEGHGSHGYNIYNYQKGDSGSLYKKIGDYSSGRLQIDRRLYKSYDKDGDVAVTHQLSQCPLGQPCSCSNNTGYNGSTRPAAPRTSEVKLADLNDNFGQLWGIILTVLTVIGILVTLFMFIYLLIFYPVKGGTSILGFLLLFGVLLIYVDNFAFLVRPNDDVCAVRRFSLGFVYALCFACMLIKVLNTWSLESYAVTYYSEPVGRRFSHPLSLLLLALAVTAVQVGFATEWLILSPARYDMVEYREELVARCAPEATHYAKLIMSCIYVMVLIALTFIFSMATWDSEENHNESRFVFFVSCFTIVIWIVWTIVATMAEIKYQDPAVIIANLANATVILVLVFVRKMYLLRKYEKDIKEEKRSRMSSISDRDGEVFHNISYVDDTGHHASTLGGSAVLYHDGSIRGADTVY